MLRGHRLSAPQPGHPRRACLAVSTVAPAEGALPAPRAVPACTTLFAAARARLAGPGSTRPPHAVSTRRTESQTLEHNFREILSLIEQIAVLKALLRDMRHGQHGPHAAGEPPREPPGAPGHAELIDQVSRAWGRGQGHLPHGLPAGRGGAGADPRAPAATCLRLLDLAPITALSQRRLRTAMTYFPPRRMTNPVSPPSGQTDRSSLEWRLLNVCAHTRTASVHARPRLGDTGQSPELGSAPSRCPHHPPRCPKPLPAARGPLLSRGQSASGLLPPTLASLESNVPKNPA